MRCGRLGVNQLAWRHIIRTAPAIIAAATTIGSVLTGSPTHEDSFVRYDTRASKVAAASIRPVEPKSDLRLRFIMPIDSFDREVNHPLVPNLLHSNRTPDNILLSGWLRTI